jgi:hypothetical protein
VARGGVVGAHNDASDDEEHEGMQDRALDAAFREIDLRARVSNVLWGCPIRLEAPMAGRVSWGGQSAAAP